MKSVYVVLVIILILNTFVYKRLQRSGRSFSVRTKILVGLIPAAISMCIAGTVEIFRQNICETQNFTQTIGKSRRKAALIPSAH